MSISASLCHPFRFSISFSPRTPNPAISAVPSCLTPLNSRTKTLSLRCNALPADLAPVTTATDAAILLADVAPDIATTNGALLLFDLAPVTAATYGALLLGGGVFAYSRSGSKGSILGGVSGAALMSAAYYLMQSPDTKELGDALGFGSAFLFSSVFERGIRLAATKKLIPSGILLTISVGVLAVFLSTYLQDKI